jgi:hypothetical protein
VAAKVLEGHYVVVSLAGGASAVKKVDLEPLTTRRVVAWPDNDLDGFTAMALAARKIEGAQMTLRGAITNDVRVVHPDQDWLPGHDIADLIDAGWDAERLLKFIGSRNWLVDSLEKEARRRFPATQAPGGEDAAKKKRPTQADIIIARARENSELFHDGDDSYATAKAGDHVETYPIRSRGFRRWLLRSYFEQVKESPNGEALGAAINTLEALAQFKGEERKVFVRIAGAGGKLYLDLCNTQWRVVEIDHAGWRIIEAGDCPVRFRRAPGMLALPTPVSGGSVADLRRFLNVAGDDDFKLIVGWLLSCYRDRGPYPVLTLHGEQGSAKSTNARVLRDLVDPNSSRLRSTPKEERDLMIAARNSWVCAYDNLSRLKSWFSDALCRLATGGGFATRTLYSDADETIFAATRPAILVSIEELATRGDLLDRSVIIYPPLITADRRLTEAEFDELYVEARPRLLGALLDNAVACALRQLDSTKLTRLPRMADFARWVAAAEPALGWKSGSFMLAYAGNRETANASALEGSIIAGVIQQLVANAAGRLWGPRQARHSAVPQPNYWRP